MTQKNKIYYLLPDEEDPICIVKSKNFIDKVMFLVVIARPRFDAQGVEIFSGKIGLFTFVTQERAKRASANRPAGTMKTKAITSVIKEISRSFLINEVLPAIKAKWPREDLNSTIFIQQDNARTHIQPNNEEFCRATAQDGFDIRLMCQPPNSLDLNVLDLEFFRSIQSLQHKKTLKSIDDLVATVIKSYEDFSTEKYNYVFLTLQSCMMEIMKVKGSHDYKIQHLSKDNLAKNGVVKYIKQTPGLDILLAAQDATTLRAYCDVDWGSGSKLKKISDYVDSSEDVAKWSVSGDSEECEGSGSNSDDGDNDSLSVPYLSRCIFME
ncbi:putative calcium-dependent protein kinase 13-like [Capsicum annuum]|nr:putative calcium-dependent protein kinase 13-like [Capsicum annuum]